jgi:hypothetical protein
VVSIHIIYLECYQCFIHVGSLLINDVYDGHDVGGYDDDCDVRDDDDSLL